MIYGIFAPATQMVKFGRSVDPRGRLASLRTGSPVELHLVFSLPWPDHMEQLIHDTFSGHRVRGEWFRVSSRMLEFLVALDKSKHDLALGLLARSRFLDGCGINDPLCGDHLDWEDDDANSPVAQAEHPAVSPEDAGSSPARGATTAYERQKRWREKNREAYNEYMREYRKRKK